MVKKNVIAFIFLVVLVPIFLVMLQKNLKQEQVCINEYCFSVEVVETSIARAKGLMFRRELADDSGMLFIFNDEKLRSFWMKNTFIPVDMIFLDKNKEVVSIEKNVQPCVTKDCPRVRPKEKSKYVLELNANIADKINLGIGDKLQFNLED